jgi:hypothetical protein
MEWNLLYNSNGVVVSGIVHFHLEHLEVWDIVIGWLWVKNAL